MDPGERISPQHAHSINPTCSGTRKLQPHHIADPGRYIFNFFVIHHDCCFFGFVILLLLSFRFRGWKNGCLHCFGFLAVSQTLRNNSKKPTGNPHLNLKFYLWIYSCWKLFHFFAQFTWLWPPTRSCTYIRAVERFLFYDHHRIAAVFTRSVELFSLSTNEHRFIPFEIQLENIHIFRLGSR